MCAFCGAEVMPVSNGSYRNHCPFCLWSKHVDLLPGDRQSSCRGLMEPVELDYRSSKGYLIVHRCIRCGHVRQNRAAVGRVQPDDLDALVALSREGLH